MPFLTSLGAVRSARHVRRTLLALLASILFGFDAAPVRAQLAISPMKGYKSAEPEVIEYGQYKLYLPDSDCKPPACKLLGQLTADRRLVLEGRIEKRFFKDREGPKVAPVQVTRELASVLSPLGYSLQNPSAGENGPFVFMAVSSGTARSWVVLDNNFGGYYTVVTVAPTARASTIAVSAAELAGQIKADGYATLYMEFDTGRSELKGDGPAMVDEISKLLKQQPALRLSVEGHTDNVGDAASNRQLSLARAQAVVVALRAKGVEAKRLAVKGHGPDIPIADNRKEAGRAKNRRVELLPLP